MATVDDPDDHPEPRHPRVVPRTDATDSGIRSRVRTPRAGVPVPIVERPSRAHRIPVPESDQIPTLALDQRDPLDVRIEDRFDELFPASFDARLRQHNDKRFRKLWGFLGASAGTALVALLAAGKSWITDAKTEGADKLRIEIFERDFREYRADTKAALSELRRDFDALRTYLIRGAPRRDDTPDPPISGASKRTP